MNAYLAETKAAVMGLIALLNRERISLENQIQSQQLMQDEEKRLFEVGKQQGFTAELCIDLYGADAAAERFGKEAAETLMSITAMQSTYGVIAGAILQIAKQGLSMAYGQIGRCPPGRSVGPQPLTSIIWSGRNQALHFEEGTFSLAVTTCFAGLETQFGPQFRLGRINLAAQIIQLLQWDDYRIYEQDMISLLPS